MMDLLRMLDAPEREFTPIPFWFLNGDLDEEEIDRQLRDFHSHGVYGVVLHPRMGLPRRIEYLSETFFRYIRHAAETAVLCRNRDLRPGTVAPLFEQQIGFQYLPESVWSLCREENGALLLGDRRL